MTRHLSTLGKQTLIYGLSAVALPAIGIITLPVFVRVFSPAEYGALEIATVGLAAALLVADLGLTSAAQRSYFDYSDDQAADRRAALTTAIAGAMIASLVVAGTMVAFREPLARWLFDGQLYTSLVVLVAAALPLSILARFLREAMRLHFRAWHYAISASLGAFVAGALGVALVLSTDMRVDGPLVGVLAGNAVAIAYGAVVAGRDVAGRLSRPQLNTMLAYGLPLVPTAAALWGLSFLDRVMLGQLGDLDEVGQYAVGARFATVLMFVVTAFSLAYSPFALSLWAEDKQLEKEIRARALTYLAIVLTGASLVLGLFAREAVSVIAPGFDTAHEVVGILCLGVTLFGLSTITMVGISFERRTELFAVYSLVAVAVNVLLNLLLIPRMGGAGAALATATAFGMLTIGYYLSSQRLYPTPFEPRKTLVVFTSGAALIGLGLLPLGVIYVAIKIAALGVFVGCLFVFRIFDAPEIAELRRVVKRFAGRPIEGDAAESVTGEARTRV